MNDPLPWIPGLYFPVHTSGHEEVVLGIEGANVKTRARICFERVQKSSLFEIESRYFWSIADKVDVESRRMVGKVSTEFWDSEPVVPAVLCVNLNREKNDWLDACE